METASIPDYPPDVTFEQMWASLQDLTEEQKEIAVVHYWLGLTFQQRENITFEQREKLRIINRWYDECESDFGDLYEYEIPEIVIRKFSRLGYHFTAIAKGGCTIWDNDGKFKAQIDLLMENSDTIMAVDIIETPKVKHIEEHIKQLEILRDQYRKLNDRRQVEGAIAGAIFGVDEKKATIEAGLYVIEQSGDTMKIEVPDGFVPRRW